MRLNKLPFAFPLFSSSLSESLLTLMVFKLLIYLNHLFIKDSNRWSNCMLDQTYIYHFNKMSKWLCSNNLLSLLTFIIFSIYSPKLLKSLLWFMKVCFIPFRNMSQLIFSGIPISIWVCFPGKPSCSIVKVGEMVKF